MKATGIVRRIDDLGRVVIPKEIRRTMRIREGDPLEIYTDREGEVIFKKYSPIGELVNFAAQYAETLYKICNIPVIICDRDCIVACAGISKKEFVEKKNSDEIDEIIQARSLFISSQSKTKAYLTDDNTNYFVTTAMPIFAEGDVIGCVAAVASENQDNMRKTENATADTEIKLIQTAAGFLGKQLEG